MVKDGKTKKISFAKAECREVAAEKLKQLTKQKGSIGAILNSSAQLVEQTLTNPKNKGEMKYENIYEMIGQFHYENLGLFKATPKTEAEAGLI